MNQSKQLNIPWFVLKNVIFYLSLYEINSRSKVSILAANALGPDSV